MLRGSCHCGAVSWRFEGEIESVTACNCTVCRRYGALWAYGREGIEIVVSGPAATYTRGKAVGFDFCPTCGCLTHYHVLYLDDDGSRKMAVNVRMSEDPAAVADLPIDHFDGLERWEDLPQDGRCVRDLWF
jgi:hypothetical protein